LRDEADEEMQAVERLSGECHHAREPDDPKGPLGSDRESRK